jgi:16S rRNA (guanine1207-N2)-methyltransferase
MIENRQQIIVTLKGIDLVLKTEPSLFSPCHVDAGTIAMLSLVDFHTDDKVLDLGCGYGPVGILAAKMIGPAHVFMIDNDPVAIQCTRLNAGLNGVPGVNVLLSNGFSKLQEAHFTKILFNPPYHTDFSVPKQLIHKAFNRLDLGGRMFMVTKYRDWCEKKLRAIFGSVTTHQVNDYNVFIATKKSFTWASTRRKEEKTANKMR